MFWIFFLFLMTVIVENIGLHPVLNLKCSITCSDFGKFFLRFNRHLVTMMSYTLFLRLFISLVNFRTASSMKNEAVSILTTKVSSTLAIPFPKIVPS